MIFLDNFFFEKNWLIFDIQNWLWKYNFGTFWRTVISRRNFLRIFPWLHVDSWPKRNLYVCIEDQVFNMYLQLALLWNVLCNYCIVWNWFWLKISILIRNFARYKLNIHDKWVFSEINRPLHFILIELFC